MHTAMHITRAVATMDSCFAGSLKTALSLQRSDGYAMLMSPNKSETAVHGCHCPGDMAVGWCIYALCFKFVCFLAIPYNEPWSAYFLNPV